MCFVYTAVQVKIAGVIVSEEAGENQGIRNNAAIDITLGNMKMWKEDVFNSGTH